MTRPPCQITPTTVLLLVLDRVAQDPDPLDLDLADVALAHPDRVRLARVADARWRSGEDDVARLERDALGDVGQHLRDWKHHVGGVVRLHDLAVEPALDLEALAGIGQLVGGDHPGAEAAGAVEILAHVPLRGLALEFAYRALVRAGITGDAGRGIGHRQVLRALADDEHQLRLVVELLRGLRPDYRLFVRHHRGEAAEEDGGKFRDVVALRAFLDVVEIIEPETDDLAGMRDWQAIAQACERALGRGGRALREVLDRGQIALGRREQRAELVRQLGVHGLKVDDPVVLDHTEPEPRLCLETYDLHVRPL